MTDSDAADRESIDARDVRALTEYMTVLEDVGEARDAPGLYTVVGQNGGTYTVDARTGACTCPDARHNLPDGDRETCKHRARVAFATGERTVPAWADRSAVDPDLGRHVAGGPRVAAADGGEIVSTDADGDGELDDARPDDCDCAPFMADDGLPCWPCYRDGFDEPNPASLANDE